MVKAERLIAWVDTAHVKGNQVLSLSVNRQDVERCARVIRLGNANFLPCGKWASAAWKR